MVTKRDTPRRIILECDHTVWMKPPVPNVGEMMFCHGCDDYRHVGPGNARVQKVYHPDDEWVSEPQGTITRGKCLVEKCGYTSTDRNFYVLRERFHDHNVVMHGTSSLPITKVPIPKVTGGLTDPPF